MTTRVKICCMASVDEARMALAHGASAIGLVSRMPSGPGPIDEKLIAEIVAALPPTVDTFLLTCETTSDAIIAQHRRTRTHTLQLVDQVDDGVHETLRSKLDGVRLVQVIHVVGRFL